MTTPTKTDFTYQGRDLEAMNFALNYHNWILEKFQPYIGQKILEIGAGSGSLTELLSRRFAREIISIEPSKQMYPLLEELVQKLNSQTTPTHPSITTHNSFLSDIKEDLKNQEIDSAVYINVLEHIPDDSQELKNVFEVLKPGGHVLTFSPALRFLMSDFDRSIGHYRRYYLDEMKQKMTQAGFKIVQAHYMDLPGIIPWYIFFTLLGKNLNSGNADTYDKLIVPILKAIEPSKILPLGKNILVIGQK